MYLLTMSCTMYILCSNTVLNVVQTQILTQVFNVLAECVSLPTCVGGYFQHKSTGIPLAVLKCEVNIPYAVVKLR